MAALITEFAVPTFQHLGRKRLHSACQFGFVNTLVFNLITALSCAPWFFHFVRFKPMRTSFSAFTADVSFLASVMLIFDQYYKFSEAMQRPVCNQRFAVISAPPGKTLWASSPAACGDSFAHIWFPSNRIIALLSLSGMTWNRSKVIFWETFSCRVIKSCTQNTHWAICTLSVVIRASPPDLSSLDLFASLVKSAKWSSSAPWDTLRLLSSTGKSLSVFLATTQGLSLIHWSPGHKPCVTWTSIRSTMVNFSMRKTVRMRFLKLNKKTHTS